MSCEPGRAICGAAPRGTAEYYPGKPRRGHPLPVPSMPRVCRRGTVRAPPLRAARRRSSRCCTWHPPRSRACSRRHRRWCPWARSDSRTRRGSNPRGTNWARSPWLRGRSTERNPNRRDTRIRPSRRSARGRIRARRHASGPRFRPHRRRLTWAPSRRPRDRSANGQRKLEHPARRSALVRTHRSRDTPRRPGTSRWCREMRTPARGTRTAKGSPAAWVKRKPSQRCSPRS